MSRLPAANGWKRKLVTRSYFIDDSVDALIATLDDACAQRRAKSCLVQSNTFCSSIAASSMTDYYWIVNDTDRKRVNQIHFAAKGIPEKWNALTGEQEPLFYVNGPSGTQVRLNLDPWDAFYVVFRRLQESPQDSVLEATNAEQLDSVSRTGATFDVHVSGPVSISETFVELRSGSQVYKGAASSGGAAASHLGW